MRFLLAILLLPLFCFSQVEEKRESVFKKAYETEKLSLTENHFKIHFIDQTKVKQDSNTHLKFSQIMLIRHQKVDIDKQFFYNYKKYEKYKYDYDIGNVLDIKQQQLLNSNEIDTVYTSTLHRSRTTAKELFGDKYTYESNPIFNELKPGTVNIPLLYLPKPLWSGLNRFFWMFGSKPKASSENRAMAKRRVNAAAILLNQKAIEKGKVVLVAHGYMNHLLRKKLRRMGWIIVEHTGNENLGGSLLVKIQE